MTAELSRPLHKAEATIAMPKCKKLVSGEINDRQRQQHATRRDGAGPLTWPALAEQNLKPCELNARALFLRCLHLGRAAQIDATTPRSPADVLA